MSLTVKEAQDKHVCRICEQPIVHTSVGNPVGWMKEFDKRLYPQPVIVLNFGKEFAHEDCLKNKEKDNEIVQN